MVAITLRVEVRIPISDVDRISVGIGKGHVVAFYRLDSVADFDTPLPESSRTPSIRASCDTTSPC